MHLSQKSPRWRKFPTFYYVVGRCLCEEEEMARCRSSIWSTPHSSLHTRFIELTPDQEKVCPPATPSQPGKLGLPSRLLILEKCSKSGPARHSLDLEHQAGLDYTGSSVRQLELARLPILNQQDFSLRNKNWKKRKKHCGRKSGWGLSVIS